MGLQGDLVWILHKQRHYIMTMATHANKWAALMHYARAIYTYRVWSDKKSQGSPRSPALQTILVCAGVCAYLYLFFWLWWLFRIWIPHQVEPRRSKGCVIISTARNRGIKGQCRHHHPMHDSIPCNACVYNKPKPRQQCYAKHDCSDRALWVTLKSGYLLRIPQR